jgi:hypothetical protein
MINDRVLSASPRKLKGCQASRAPTPNVIAHRHQPTGIYQPLLPAGISTKADYKAADLLRTIFFGGLSSPLGDSPAWHLSTGAHTKDGDVGEQPYGHFPLLTSVAGMLIYRGTKQSRHDITTTHMSANRNQA